MIAQQVTPATFRLTAREERILRLLALGFTNDEISRKTGYTVSSVRNAIATIYRLAGLRNRVEACRWMLERDPSIVVELRESEAL